MPNSRLLVRSGTVLVDGRWEPGAGVLVDRGHIVSVLRPDEADSAQVDESIDASGCLVFSGIVNGHAHGCTTGPLFSSGAKPLAAQESVANLDRHLASGVTTLVNVCGFGVSADVPRHAVDVLLGTTHLPSAVAAADLVDGCGLDARHRSMTAERMITDGAVALGEIGSGATLGGGVAAYRYLPDALESHLARRLDPHEATLLIDALVGASRTGDPDDVALERCMSELGIPHAAAGPAREAILRFASAPVHASLDSFDEAAELSARLGVPAVFHLAAPSAGRLLHLARTTQARIIAGHVNHTSFTPEEAVAWGEAFRESGAVIDVSSLDIVHARRLATPDVADALAGAGLVDTLSTDYAGGAWEPMLDLVQRWCDLGLSNLADGIAMCTSAPARALGLEDRGRIAPGLRADLVVTAPENVGDVRIVISEGRIVWTAPGSEVTNEV